ncbi:MAG TPA: PQQ-binding-like beta-propeller repeat protein [Flavisolibacter sp.]|jgi:outer membrane protein assembly factor BamB|nr:PQQ-binding-like beta-propeller repeat protein [Flavisolibacter sp.]
MLLFFLGCQKPNQREPQSPVTANQKVILSFDLKKADNPSLGSDIYGIIGTDSIQIILPSGSIPGSYVPTITFKGKSIDPKNQTAQNFANPVTYTVTAQDGSTKSYIVSIRAQLSSDKTITLFQFQASRNTGKLTADITGTITADAVTLTVPTGTNLSSLTPTIATSGKTVSPASLLPQDFTNAVNYTVTAEDGTTKTYTITVLVAAATPTVYMKSKWGHGSPPVTGKFYAFDAETGALKWLYETEPSPPVHSTGTYASGIIYTVIGPDIKALDAQTGIEKWKYTPPIPPSTTPAVANGKVYVNCDDNKLYALDAETGAVLWTFAQGERTSDFARNYCDPTVVDGVVFFGSPDKHVYALDAMTGALKWKTKSQNPIGTGEFSSNPAVANGVLYIGDSYNNFSAYSTADGKELWRYNTSNGYPSSSTVENDIVYFGASNNTLYALDAKTGVPKWGYGAGASIKVGPIVENGVVYVATEGAGIQAVNAITGEKKWSSLGNYDIKGSPVVFNSTVYVGAGPAFYALNAATGALKWQYTASSNMNTFAYTSPFAVDVNGKTYYPVNSGQRQ